MTCLAKQNAILLRDKGESTKFQILFEVMCNQPHVKQKDIGDKLSITTQAVCKYFKRLVRDGFLEVGSERADYRLTPKGVILLRDNARNLANYVRSIKQEMKVEHTWVALATSPVKAGERVGLITKGGLLYTVSTDDVCLEAMGTDNMDAKVGEDLGVKDLSGKIKLKQGKVLIIKLPTIRKGGSRAADLVKIKVCYDEFKPDRVGVMGAVARGVVKKLNLAVDFEFGISHSAAVAASRGLSVFVLVVGRMVNRVIREIDLQNMRFDSGITYEVKDSQLMSRISH
jgi:putative transcriptional regulator